MSTREITLEGGSPWGFRIHGGADTTQPLRVSRVNPGSGAAQRGVREGDLISTINGQPTRQLTNSEAHHLLRTAGNTLVLGLNQESAGSPKRRAHRVQEQREEHIEKTTTTSTTYTSTISRITTTSTSINNIENNKQNNINNNCNTITTNSRRTPEAEKPHQKSSSQLKNGYSTDSRGCVEKENEKLKGKRITDTTESHATMPGGVSRSRKRRTRSSRRKKHSVERENSNEQSVDKSELSDNISCDKKCDVTICKLDKDDRLESDLSPDTKTNQTEGTFDQSQPSNNQTRSITDLITENYNKSVKIKEQFKASTSYKTKTVIETKKSQSSTESISSASSFDKTQTFSQSSSNDKSMDSSEETPNPKSEYKIQQETRTSNQSRLPANQPSKPSTSDPNIQIREDLTRIMCETSTTQQDPTPKNCGKKSSRKRTKKAENPQDNPKDIKKECPTSKKRKTTQDTQSKIDPSEVISQNLAPVHRLEKKAVQNFVPEFMLREEASRNLAQVVKLSESQNKIPGTQSPSVSVVSSVEVINQSCLDEKVDHIHHKEKIEEKACKECDETSDIEIVKEDCFEASIDVYSVETIDKTNYKRKSDELCFEEPFHEEEAFQENLEIDIPFLKGVSPIPYIDEVVPDVIPDSNNNEKDLKTKVEIIKSEIVDSEMILEVESQGNGVKSPETTDEVVNAENLKIDVGLEIEKNSSDEKYLRRTGTVPQKQTGAKPKSSKKQKSIGDKTVSQEGLPKKIEEIFVETKTETNSSGNKKDPEKSIRDDEKVGSCDENGENNKEISTIQAKENNFHVDNAYLKPSNEEGEDSYIEESTEPKPSFETSQNLLEKMRGPSLEDEYIVESPKSTKVIKGQVIKCRSLDDDIVKITEVEDSSDTEKIPESNKAIVSEAESDLEWETTEDFQDDNQSLHYGKLSIISLPLVEHRIENVSNISPEEEKNLRSFLEALNLGTPDDSKKSEKENSKARKAKKRAAIAQHFLPYFHNPRYLDVISEEGSDLSDSDRKSETMSHARPLIINPYWPNGNPLEHLTLTNDAILVGTKMIESGEKQKPLQEASASWSYVTEAECSSKPEVIYLDEDSSDSMTPSDMLEQEEAQDADGEDEESEIEKSLDECLEMESNLQRRIINNLNDSISNISKIHVFSVNSQDLCSDFNNKKSYQENISSDLSQSSMTDQIPQINNITPEVDRTHIEPINVQNDSPKPLSEVNLPKINNENPIGLTIAQSATLENSNSKTVPLENIEQILQENVENPLSDHENQSEVTPRSSSENMPTLSPKTLSESAKKTLFANLEQIIKETSEITNQIPNLEDEPPKVSESSTKAKIVQNLEKIIIEIKNIDSQSESTRISTIKDTLGKKSIPTVLETSDNTLSNESFLNDIVSTISAGDNKNLHKLIDDPRFELLPIEIKGIVNTLKLYLHKKDVSEGKTTDDEFCKEFRSFCEGLKVDEPSRPGSSNSERSSRSTSQCTALYNPINSSLTNIAALLKEDIPENILQPSSLKEICVQKLLKMPFGTEIMEELAVVSSSIEDLTNSMYLKEKIPKIGSGNIPVNNFSSSTDSKTNWVGMPLEENPSVLVCLSPAQKSYIETVRNTPKEADSLLDLHQKYMDRELPPVPPIPNSEVTISSLRVDGKSHSHQKWKDFRSASVGEVPKPSKRASSYIDYQNFMREFQKENQDPDDFDGSIKDDGNINYNNYIKKVTREVPIQVERQIHRPVNNLVYMDEETSKRLNAKHVYEWLNLARKDIHKIRAPLTKYHSCDGLDIPDSRRRSLPYELYERQMQYILNKEREIQMEIDRLEEEKYKLELMEKSKSEGDLLKHFKEKKFFDASNYQISKKGDIAIHNSDRDLPSENFRQKMFDEWINKMAEREERKQHKVIKITSTTTTQQESSETVETKHNFGLEDEFMEKVKKRNSKLGLEEEDAMTTIPDDSKDNTKVPETQPVKVIDGAKVSERSNLPKHLQEFVEYIKTEENTTKNPEASTEPIKVVETKKVSERSFLQKHLQDFVDAINVEENINKPSKDQKKEAPQDQIPKQNEKSTTGPNKIFASTPQKPKERSFETTKEFESRSSTTKTQSGPNKITSTSQKPSAQPSKLAEKFEELTKTSGKLPGQSFEATKEFESRSSTTETQHQKIVESFTKMVEKTTSSSSEVFRTTLTPRNLLQKVDQPYGISTGDPREKITPNQKQVTGLQNQKVFHSNTERQEDKISSSKERPLVSNKLPEKHDKTSGKLPLENLSTIGHNQKVPGTVPKTIFHTITREVEESKTSGSKEVSRLASSKKPSENGAKVPEKQVTQVDSPSCKEARAQGTVPPLEVKILDSDSKKVSESTLFSKHFQDFLNYLHDRSDPGVWSPNKSTEVQHFQNDTVEKPNSITKEKENDKGGGGEEKNDEPMPVIWTPSSANASPVPEKKEFRPIKFESPILGRKNRSKESTPVTTPDSVASVPPPWDQSQEPRSEQDRRPLSSSHSAPTAGLSSLAGTKLPKAQNPTITLLQKAREGQLPRGASYIEESTQSSQRRIKDDRPPIVGQHDIPVYVVKSEYMKETDSDKPKKMADLGHRKFEGIGPTTKDGMPIAIRSEVKEPNQHKWYKRMYDTLHKTKPDDEYVTVRYKTRRGRYPYTSAGGYLSEPEPNAYDSDASQTSTSKYATLDRRRLLTANDKENEFITYTVPRSNRYMSASVRHTNEVYKNQPGRIENYVPGHSSISEKEAKEWWDEVMEIFDGWLDDHAALPSLNYMLSQVTPSTTSRPAAHLEQQKHVPQKSFMSHALKESGYESDSQLVFRRREDGLMRLPDPVEQRQAYKEIQRGGEVPLHGLRKPAPERPKEPPPAPTPPPKGLYHGYFDREEESPRRYVENEVTIHYRSPVRQEIKEAVSEEELARRQADAMRRIYQEERRRKYLQELQDMNSRRHGDNFTPSQKSPIPLNRYDNFLDEVGGPTRTHVRESSPEPRIVARALYNFVGQTSRELTFRKGDIIYIRRQVDKNWYEGEHNAMVGLFPANYVEIVPYEKSRPTVRKPHEGQARAKFNFIAQTPIELSLAKGELVVLTRRVDQNWFEGRIGSRVGIFPVSYVDILIDPQSSDQKIELTSSKPVASPASHSLIVQNGSSGGHHYQPGSYKGQGIEGSFHAKPAQVTNTLTRTTQKTAINQVLHIDTHNDPVAYRAMYKYRPQNDDELELLEGDTVFVIEKCDDGWFVGSSQRTGAFGTFPGNYVERI